ncbi:MAG: chromate transporter [Bulleidia sp.]
MEKKISYGKLFLTMLEISAFTFGGGFVIIGMMQKKFCGELHWVSEDEVMDMCAIAQSSPGALAVNSAIIFGYRMGGIKGALLSTLAVIIPPLIIISVICTIYDAFCTNRIVQTALQVMRAGVAAVIVDVVWDLASNVIHSHDIINIVMMVISFIASWFFKVSAIQLILFFLILGTARYYLERRHA